MTLSSLAASECRVAVWWADEGLIPGLVTYLGQLIAWTRDCSAGSVWMQGLLSAMAAKVRAKQRHLASTAPSLLQFTSTRTAADKALKDAETATEAALQVIAGMPLLSTFGSADA